MPTPTRILMLEPCHENYGGYFRAHGLARGLAAQGYDVTLVISSGEKRTLRIEKTVEREHLTVIKLPRFELNWLLNGRFLRAFLNIGMLMRHRWDLVHMFAIVQIETLLPFLFARAFFRRTRVILDWDDYWTDTPALLPMYKRFPFSLIGHFYRFCEYKVQRLARHATATSEFLKNEYAKIGVTDCLKVINGVDIEQFEPCRRDEARNRLGIGEDQIVLLTFGNTYFKERTLYLLRLFEAFYALDQTIVLYTNVRLRQIAQRAGYHDGLNPEIWPNIRNVGYFEGEKLANYMGACDAVVFLMGDRVTEQACFPTRIGTFLNGERFIITNDTPTEACWVLKEHDCALIDTDLERLARRSLETIRDPAAKQRIEENARKAKDRLTWESLGRDLAAFYEKVLGRSGRTE